MAGLSANGFEIIRLPEIIEEKNTLADVLFGDLVAVGDTVDKSGNSTLGRMIGLVSPSEATIWETLQQLHNAFNITGATGVALDNLVALGSVTRLQATPSRGYIALQGLVDTFVPAGTAFSSTTSTATFTTDTSAIISATDATGVVVSVLAVIPSAEYTLTITPTSGGVYVCNYQSTETPTLAEILAGIQTAVLQASSVHQVTISSDTLLVVAEDPFDTASYVVNSNLGISQATTLATISASTTGPTASAVNTITRIPVAVNGLVSVFNPEDLVLGRLVETDEQLRLRFKGSSYINASNILEALHAKLLEISSVKQVVIYENDSDATDERGLPEHSFMVLVNGGFAPDIGLVIHQNRPAGIESVGNVSVVIRDKYGANKTVMFSRPEFVDLYINMDIEETPLFPQDGENLIRQALVAYFDTVTMGGEVLYSRLYTPINSVPGHYISSLMIGTQPTALDTKNISINYNQVVRLLPQNITFT